ncbi:putative ATP-dependent RNA helicase [Yasminevirus sp. GU-2018]|uniref:Putative ATP-dependent RNA helicase n=1 Tax=Yasminevirus sp. GU-2018 TaxID=2420051 RepID=A0A5K0U8K2_9VIRU|nr:putative ATP-dependent RNA helicase [Yasminevirus sp. GU-2018]
MSDTSDKTKTNKRSKKSVKDNDSNDSNDNTKHDDDNHTDDNQKRRGKKPKASKTSKKEKDNSKIELKPHQQLPVDYMKTHRALLLYHSTGSGKTITAIEAMYQFDENIIIIGPKSSKKAFFDEIKKLGLDAGRFKFYTYTKLKKLIKETNIDILSDFSVIIDEAHALRNETMDNMMLISALELVKRVILLTATPVINYLNDLAVLVNILKNRAVLPTDIRTFNASYYDEETGTITNRDILVDKLRDCISYYDRKLEHEDYPESDTVYIDVEMNEQQLDEYRFYLRKFLYDQTVGSLTYKIDFENINPKKKNFFLSNTRQLSNTLNGNSDFPKIKRIYEIIKKGPFPCVVYSNYLKNGVFAMTPLLEKDDITYKTITGETNDEKISKIVDTYNKGRYQVLLITSAGSESLDLKNTRQIHIMEPHWNESKIKQVIGRVIRYKSHSLLPPEQRHVTIYRWCSVFPELINNMSADQYLIELSKKKDSIFKQFNDLIKTVSIENGDNIPKRKQKSQRGGRSVHFADTKQSYIDNKMMYLQLMMIDQSRVFLKPNKVLD